MLYLVSVLQLIRNQYCNVSKDCDSEMITTKKRRHMNVETTASLSIRNISVKSTYQLKASLVM